MGKLKSEKEVKLTAKQKAFVAAYLGSAHFNATQAARLAGYAGNDDTLKSVASENIAKPYIKAMIDEGLAALTMPANEVLARLTAIAKGKVTDVSDTDGKFDLEKAKQSGADALLKKIKVKRNTRIIREADETGKFNQEIETSILTEEIEFELYSAHEALRDLGKYHKLFTEKVQHEGEIASYHMTREEWEKRANDKLKKANDTLTNHEE